MPEMFLQLNSQIQENWIGSYITGDPSPRSWITQYELQSYPGAGGQTSKTWSLNGPIETAGSEDIWWPDADTFMETYNLEFCLWLVHLSDKEWRVHLRGKTWDLCTEVCIVDSSPPACRSMSNAVYLRLQESSLTSPNLS